MTTPGTELNTELLLALPMFLSRSQQSCNIIYLTDSPFMTSKFMTDETGFYVYIKEAFLQLAAAHAMTFTSVLNC